MRIALGVGRWALGGRSLSLRNPQRLRPNALLPLLSLAAFATAALVPRNEEPWVVLVGGDTQGYLSPCGCTKPMTGGLRRRASAVRALTVPGRTLLLENGAHIAGTGRQDQMKAETLVEAVAEMGDAAIHITPSEARLGRGSLLALAGLSGGRLVSTSLPASEGGLEIKRFRARGPFLVGGATVRPEALGGPLGERALRPERAVADLVAEAEGAGLAPLLMFDGGQEEAIRLAEGFPALRLVVYRSTGDPSGEPLRVGKTLLVTPGESGKHVVRLSFSAGAFEGYAPTRLDPRYGDDPAVSRLYKAYLGRVDAENLLEKLPRTKTAAFAGTPACGSCHAEALAVWKKSEHSHALATLEKDGHARDPDCVGCHVVGLASDSGFRSRGATPNLADVGCESCHGPGKAHADAPKRVDMPKVGERACAPCHTPSMSPNFTFAEYWAKIRHK